MLCTRIPTIWSRSVAKLFHKQNTYYQYGRFFKNPSKNETKTTRYTIFTRKELFYDFACSCLCGEASETMISWFLSLRFSNEVLVGDNCEGLTVSTGLELRDCSSSGEPKEAPCGTPPVSTYWESSAWKDGTDMGDFVVQGKPNAGLNIGGKGRPGQKWWSEVTWGKPRWACRAKSGKPGWSIVCMNGPASLPSAFSRFRHFARRFWNQTWKKKCVLNAKLKQFTAIN